MNTIRIFSRPISVVLIITFLLPFLVPTKAYALTSALPQEIAEYEPPGSTDMVNLLTGDFQYSIPLLDIPSRGGGFSLPLSYHAGISMEQDASWVGLGWSLNPGAIVRGTSEFPDDIRQGTVVNVAKDEGVTGYHVNALFYQRTRIGNSLGGSIGLSGIVQVGFGSNSGNGSILGMSGDNSAAMNIVGFASTVLSFATCGATGFAKSLITDAAMEVGIGAITGAASARSFGSGTTSADWTMESKGSAFFGKRSFRYYLDKTRTERVYGSLYLQHIPLEAYAQESIYDQWSGTRLMQQVRVYGSGETLQQTSTDSHFYHDASQGPYAFAKQPTSLAYDKYQVQGESVLGTMQPYRLDVGFLSKGSMVVNEMTLAPVQWTNSKPQFRFMGSPSNSYMHHATNEVNGTSTATGIEEEMEENGYWALWKVTDPKLADPEVRLEADRDPNGIRANSLVNGRLIQGKNIEWFTNREIRNGHGLTDGRFLDHHLNDQRQLFRDGLPEHGIGAFAVTDLNGITYHYTIPVLNKYQLSKVGKGNNNYSSTSMDSDYAVAWLLTTITGPDFVDRNQNCIADAGDWGDWVRFSYGRFSSNYRYCYPYSYGNGANGESFDMNKDEAYRDISMFGGRESYYLNRIHTNTHSALFIKSLRQDGRSGYHDTDRPKPASTLKLDEVVLLKNEDYQRLIGTCSDCHGLGDFSIAHPRYADIHGASTGDTFDKILDAYDISAPMRAYLSQTQLIRIVFNYSYELCPGTWNSFDMTATVGPPTGLVHGTGGKLTLRSITQKGRQDVKMMPDYEFKYNGPNPAYDRAKVDGWGMHCSSCGSNVYGASRADELNTQYNMKFYANVDAHQATADGAAWSLTDIVTPTGAELHIDYERDTYSSVFGRPTSLRMALVANSEVDLAQRTFDVASNIDLLNYPFLQGEPSLDVPPPPMDYGCGQALFLYPHGARVSVEGSHKLRYHCGPQAPTCDWGGGFCALGDAGNGIIGYRRLAIGTSEKYGGDLRVKRIAMKDPFSGQQLTTSYTYTESGVANGRSTGSVTSEPDLCMGKGGDFEKFYDLPGIPVMYGKVTVRSGSGTVEEGVAREVYQFRLPSEDMLSLTSVDERYDHTHNGPPARYIRRTRFNVKIRTSGIGDLLAKETFDNRGYSAQRMMISYADELPGKLAHFTEGSILCARVGEPGIRVLKTLRTTKHYIPSIPVATTVTTQGSTQTIENTKFDFLTGTVLESLYGDSWGARYRTKVVPAYKRYPGMGSKALDPANANLMSLPAEDHLYALVNGQEKPVNVGITTYAKDWDYPGTVNGELSYTPSSKTWHQKEQYVWKDKLASDGTYADMVPFNFSAGAVQDDRWVRAGRTTNYDTEGRVVEVEDINGHRSASLYGMDGRFVIASGTFAKLSELRYSGAEERIPGTDHFEGRLSGAAAVSTGAFAHTGSSSLRLSPGQQGFLFEAALDGNSPTNIGRQDYRASVWVHERNLARGRLFFQGLNSNGTQVPGGYGVVAGEAYKFKAGKWYLLELKIPAVAVQSAARLRVGVENDASVASTANDDFIYVDDMRFHPYMGSFTSNVYDPRTGNLLATLDEDNRAVRYTYDALGRVTLVEMETATGFVPSKSYEYKFMRQP